MGKADIFKPTIGDESLHQDSEDNCVRILNFTTSKYLIMGTIFPHRNIHTHTWTSRDGKIHNRIDHVLIDRKWHSYMINVRSFREADCDTDHCVVDATVRKRLEVNKHAAQKFDMERFISGS